MKTIQKIVMLTVLMATATSVRAQYDTTAWPDPWYLYHPKPDCAMTDPHEVLKDDDGYFNLYDYTLHGFTNPMYYATEDITIYGIAVTMDTLYKVVYVLHPITSDTIGVEGDTCFNDPNDMRLYVKLLKAKDVGKVYVADSVLLFNCDTIKPAYGRRHHTKFRYDCDTLVDSMVANCWELYFKEPHLIAEGDSFYVGLHGSSLDRFLSRYIIAAEKDDPDKPYVKQGSHLIHYPGSETVNYWGVGYKYWGYLFPIVGLRCTEPKGLRLERQSGDTAVFSWTMYNLAESYEVLVVNDSTGDSTVHYLTPDDTSFTLTGIDSLQQYSIRVRKSCRYSTEGYDSIVVSGWSSAVTLEAKTPPDTTDTTATDTTWIHRVDGADFTLKPNPARGRCLLQLGSAAADGSEVEVTDMRGITVLRRRLEPGARSAELDIAALPAGAYMVKLVTPQGIASRRLLVR